MKVAINIVTENPYRPSGAFGYYRNLVPEMLTQAPADEIYLIVSPALRPHFEFEAPNLRFLQLPASNERTFARLAGEHLLLPPRLRSAGIEVLNTGNVAPLWLPCRLVATIKTMHAFTSPDAMSFPKRFYRRVVGGRTARRATLIIANSEANRADIIEYFHVPEERTRIVYEALDHAVFNPAEEPDERDRLLARLGVRQPFVVFVSSLWRYKNAELLIRATRSWRGRLPELQTVIVGYHPDAGYVKELKSLATELGVADRVRFTGGLKHIDIAHLYRAAECLVYPSKYETFGLPLPEAMACRCPVVASTAGSLTEIAGGAARLFEPHDEEALAAHVIRLVEDPDVRAELVARGVERAAQFSWRRTARETLAVYREACSA